MARLPGGQNASRQRSSWTDSHVDTTTRRQNPELTEAKVDKILGGPKFMWPDSQVDGSIRKQNQELTEQ